MFPFTLKKLQLFYFETKKPDRNWRHKFATEAGDFELQVHTLIENVQKHDPPQPPSKNKSGCKCFVF